MSLFAYVFSVMIQHNYGLEHKEKWFGALSLKLSASIHPPRSKRFLELCSYSSGDAGSQKSCWGGFKHDQKARLRAFEKQYQIDKSFLISEYRSRRTGWEQLSVSRSTATQKKKATKPKNVKRSEKENRSKHSTGLIMSNSGYCPLRGEKKQRPGRRFCSAFSEHKDSGGLQWHEFKTVFQFSAYISTRVHNT